MLFKIAKCIIGPWAQKQGFLKKWMRKGLLEKKASVELCASLKPIWLGRKLEYTKLLEKDIPEVRSKSGPGQI